MIFRYKAAAIAPGTQRFSFLLKSNNQQSAVDTRERRGKQKRRVPYQKMNVGNYLSKVNQGLLQRGCGIVIF